MSKIDDNTLKQQVMLLTRGCEAVYTQQELEHKLKNAGSRQLRVKYGMDPTSPDIHLGHTVQMRILRKFQDMGHRVVLIIGDYTAMIGDPSGRDTTRPMLTAEEIARNAETYLDQAGLILDTDPAKLEVRRNSEWLGGLSYADLLKITSMATVQQMIARENFKNRLEAGREIVVTELLYPLMQGYDSIAIKADVEFGGSDQTFNCLLGRDMMAKSGMDRQVVMITPILVGLDGAEKMSKSKGNYIAVRDDANNMFGKIMSIPDSLMDNYFTLLTDLPRGQIDELVNPQKTHPRKAKAALGEMIVAGYYGQAAGKAASAEFDRVFAQKDVPTDMPEVQVPAAAMNIVELIVHAGFAKSKGEARRLVEQNAVSIDGDRIADIDASISLKTGQVLKVGKRRFGKIVVG